jgi:hypothetical protein
MEAIKKICLQCQSPFFIQRNPNQHYCSQKACQKKRQNQWRQQKRQQDRDYRDNQRVANRNWRKKNPHYWQSYRAARADYVVKNRERQRERDRDRDRDRGLPSGDPLKAARSHLANSDAFLTDNILKSGTYDLVPAMPNLANSDALRVKITLISME